MAELFDSLTAAPVVHTFVQYLIRRKRHFRQYFSRDNFRPEIVSDVISGLAVQHVGVDVYVKVGGSRSNRFRYIQTAHFVMDDERRRRHWHTQVIT